MAEFVYGKKNMRGMTYRSHMSYTIIMDWGSILGSIAGDKKKIDSLRIGGYLNREVGGVGGLF
jgi:hypothetical protein